MDECVPIKLRKVAILSAGSRKAPCSSSPTAVGPSGPSCLLLKLVKDLRVLFLLLLCKFPGPLLSLARAVATKKIQLQISKNRLLEFFDQLWKVETSESTSQMFLKILDLQGTKVSEKNSKEATHTLYLRKFGWSNSFFSDSEYDIWIPKSGQKYYPDQNWGWTLLFVVIGISRDHWKIGPPFGCISTVSQSMWAKKTAPFFRTQRQTRLLLCPSLNLGNWQSVESPQKIPSNSLLLKLFDQNITKKEPSRQYV